MAKIQIKDLTYYYDEFYHPVFEHITLRLDSDWNLGLIGRNGKGKTTFLNLLAGRLEPSGGEIERVGSIAMFPYDYNGRYHKTMDVIKECMGDFATIEERLSQMQRQLENNEGNVEAYCELLDYYEQQGGYELESRIEREVAKFHFPMEILERDFASLSGGEKTCMHIVALFLRKDPFVLLDEPTNHLDIEKKVLLAEYLKTKKGFIVVSHDYVFLNQVVDHILAINKADIVLEKGNYDTFKTNMEHKEEYERCLQEKLVREITSLENRAVNARDWSSVGNKQKYDFCSNARANGSRAYMRIAKRAEQRIKDDIEQKKKLLRNVEEEKELSILRQMMEEPVLVKLENCSFGYEKNRLVFDKITLSIEPGNRIWIQGKNGAGKSTLLKIIMGELETDGIEYCDGVRISYASQEPKWCRGNIKSMMQKEKLLEGIFQKICASFDLPEDMYERPLETFSSGERKKIDIARAISTPNDLLILDEPLNYMDYMFKKQLAKALVEQEVTVVFVEHDREFGKTVSNKILYL